MKSRVSDKDVIEWILRIISVNFGHRVDRKELIELIEASKVE